MLSNCSCRLNSGAPRILDVQNDQVFATFVRSKVVKDAVAAFAPSEVAKGAIIFRKKPSTQGLLLGWKRGPYIRTETKGKAGSMYVLAGAKGTNVLDSRHPFGRLVLPLTVTESRST